MKKFWQAVTLLVFGLVGCSQTPPPGAAALSSLAVSPYTFKADSRTAFPDLTVVRVDHISDDGSTIFAVTYSKTTRIYHLLRWTAATGFQDLGTMPEEKSFGVSYVTPDGKTATGAEVTTTGYKGWRWTPSTGIQRFNENFTPKFGNADGTKIVGHLGDRPALWDNGTVTLFELPQDYDDNVDSVWVTDANKSFTAFVGTLEDGDENKAATWTGTSQLTYLPGNVYESYGGFLDSKAYTITASGLIEGDNYSQEYDGGPIDYYTSTYWQGGGNVQEFPVPSGSRYQDIRRGDDTFFAKSGEIASRYSLSGALLQTYPGSIKTFTDDGNFVVGIKANTNGESLFVSSPLGNIPDLTVQNSFFVNSAYISKNGGAIAATAREIGATYPYTHSLVVWTNQGTSPSPKQDQTITFTSTPPSSATIGSTYAVSATASSGLPVTFSSATPNICTVSGSTVSFVAAGNCTVNANQAGNSSYNPAPTATQSSTITADKQNQAITFTSTPTSSAAIGSTYTVSATASSGLAVSFTSATPNVCNASNNTVSFVAAGTCTVSASQVGNASYNAAPTVSQDITVTADPETPTTDPETPATSTYTIGFENVPTNQILKSLRVGQDITGPATSGRIAVSGKRIIRGKYRGGNYAKVVDLYGSKRLIVAASKSGTTPNPRGGRIQFAFNAGAGFGSGSVTVNTITLSNVTADGASVNLYRGRTLIRQVDVPVTGAGESVTLTLDEPGVTTVSALARFPMAVDNLVVSQ